jgi:biotin operon repressor
MASADLLLQHLALLAQGRHDGITGEALAHALGVNERRVRRWVSELRERGIAICATPGNGYFIPTTPEELKESCAFLEHRALHSLVLLSRMRNCSLPELLGQLNLTETEAS